MDGTSEKTTPSKSDTLKGLFTAISKAKLSSNSGTDKERDSKNNAAGFKLNNERIQKAKQTVTEITISAGHSVKSGAVYLGNAIDEAKNEVDRKSLRPVFKDTLDQTIPNTHTPPLPELVCIVEHDKKHDESSVCNGSIGYWKTVKGIDILNLYEESAHELGWNFVPSVFQTFYYVDNYKQGTYISLNHFFDYFKKQRVNELESIAQDLGAKHVKITFQEHEKIIVKSNSRANVKAGSLKADISHENSRNDDAKFEIAADIHFLGQDTPKVPALVYFKRESDIERLVEMRMKPGNPIKSKDYHFQCSSSAGMSEKVAAKLDGILQQLKCSGTATISSEIQRENRTELNYHIEF